MVESFLEVSAHDCGDAEWLELVPARWRWKELRFAAELEGGWRALAGPGVQWWDLRRSPGPIHPRCRRLPVGGGGGVFRIRKGDRRDAMVWVCILAHLGDGVLVRSLVGRLSEVHG